MLQQVVGAHSDAAVDLGHLDVVPVLTDRLPPSDGV
jgi:hypothetical protein